MVTVVSPVVTLAPTGAPSPTSSRILSIVCVLRNGAPGLIDALVRLHSELSALALSTEIVAVLNGGGAADVLDLRRVTERHERLHVYVMKRRVDSSTALIAGIENAIGDWIVTLDLEADSPAIVARLFEAASREGADIAVSLPQGLSRPLYEAALSRLFHRVFRALNGFSIPADASSARLLSRAVANSLLRHDSPLVAYETLFSEGDYRRCNVPTILQSPARRGMGERARSCWRTLIGVNAVPLRLANLVCGVSAFTALMFSAYVIVVYLLKDDVVPGWTTVSLMLSLMFMMLALVLWLLSEYMLMLLDPASRRPRYEITEEFGGQLRSGENTLNVETQL